MNAEREHGPERLRGLLEDDQAARSLRIHVLIFGGPKSEQLQVDADIVGTGRVAGRLEDAITDRAGSFDGQMPDRDFRSLLELLASDEFISQPNKPTLFPPDTIVGTVEITLAGDHVGTYQAAVDEDQIASTDLAGSPTSKLLASVLQTAESLVEGGNGPRPTAAR